MSFDEMMNELAVPNLSTVRSTAQHLMLDILFYATPPHSSRILETMAGELNRVYRLFKRYNPEFRGTVSFIGHSLGAALVSDILAVYSPPRELPRPPLDFDVDKVFCVGSPYSVFLLLRHTRPIGCRASPPWYPNISHNPPPSSPPPSTLIAMLGITSLPPSIQLHTAWNHYSMVSPSMTLKSRPSPPLSFPVNMPWLASNETCLRSIEGMRSSLSFTFLLLSDLAASPRGFHFPTSPYHRESAPQTRSTPCIQPDW